MTDTTISAFETLLSPGAIGSLRLRNRIVMCPMGDNLTETDGTISENQLGYFEARARGGAGLLLVGSVSVSYPVGAFGTRQLAGSDDRYLDGLTELAERAHRHGAAIAAQLVHNGQMSLLDVANRRPVLVPAIPKAPNPDRWLGMVSAEESAAMMIPYTQPTSKLEYQVATEADIAWVIERFVDTAERCQRAGFDGIELHAGHGYLLDEFLTASINDRTDGWGGSVENRARLLLEVLRAIRARVGDEFPLWIRINAVEHHKSDGEQFDDQLRVIDMALAEGIDAVHVTAYASTDVATGPTDSYVPHTVGPLADYAAAVRARVDVPVITYGRFEPGEAEQVLVDGKGDFVGFGRKLLADPDLPNKLAAGRLDDIRPCVYQYRCIGNIFLNDSLHCVVNAETGREHDLDLPPAGQPRHVLVIGGGAAGLETARVVAARGHRVTLWEASPRLGGVLVPAGKADPLLDRYRGWLVGAVERAGVSIEVGRRASVDAVRELGADEVVVATGARWDGGEIPGADLPHVRTVPDLEHWLADDGDDVGRRVVVIGGQAAGLAIARRCLDRGREVTVVEPTSVLGAHLGLPGRWRVVPDLDADGARLRPSTSVVAITDAGVTVRLESGETEELAADTVIVTTPAAPTDALSAELRAAGIHVRVVGDANPDGIGRLEGANLDAAEVAKALD